MSQKDNGNEPKQNQTCMLQQCVTSLCVQVWTLIFGPHSVSREKWEATLLLNNTNISLWLYVSECATPEVRTCLGCFKFLQRHHNNRDVHSSDVCRGIWTQRHVWHVKLGFVEAQMYKQAEDLCWTEGRLGNVHATCFFVICQRVYRCNMLLHVSEHEWKSLCLMASKRLILLKKILQL